MVKNLCERRLAESAFQIRKVIVLSKQQITLLVY